MYFEGSEEQSLFVSSPSNSKRGFRSTIVNRIERSKFNYLNVEVVYRKFNLQSSNIFWN